MTSASEPTGSQPDRPLDGLRILDLSATVGGAFCTRLLADLGADVVMVETATRDLPDSGGWPEFLLAGKRSVMWPDAAAALPRLAERADAVVTTYRNRLVDGHGSDAGVAGLAGVLRSRPELVTVELSPFGASGPYRDWQATDITQWALGGYMYYGGTSDRPPLLLPEQQAELHGGMQAAFAVLAGLRHVQRTGDGQHAEVANLEAVLSAHWRLSVMWSHTGEVWKRLAPEAIDYLTCLDGEVFIQRNGRYDDTFFALIERPDLAGDARWSTPAAAAVNGDEIWAEVRAWAGRNTVADVIKRAQDSRLAASAVSTLPEFIASEQLVAREVIVNLHSTDGVIRRLPGAPYRMSGSVLGPYSWAPQPGADNPAALDGTLWPPGPTRMETAREATGRGASKDRPETSGALAGVRVLELGANWAGPMMTRSMADLGADVVKVEGARRPATRVMLYPGNEPGKYFYNRSGYFNKMNRNKLGVSLDITTEPGREVFLQLAAWADVFVENQSPQVLHRLRITYDDLRAVNPRLIMVCVSGYGLTGPAALHAAYGTNIEASGGLSSMFGYEPGEKLRTGSLYADPLAGTLGAIAVLAALRQRDRTGQGQLIDLALQETMLAFFGAAVTDVLAGRPARSAQGNRSSRWAPQGCYPCQGEDMWVVLSVRDETEFAALCQVIGRTDLAARADLATTAGRRTAHDELDAAIAAWTARQDHREAAELLQAVAVPAAPVLKNWELLADPHLYERQFYVPIPHPDTGVLPYPSFPWKFGGTPAQVYRRAPRFAEHNDHVFRDILGLSLDRIDQLARDGIIDTVPVTG